jgi:phosphomannomutase / phosphoglucomutase
LLQAAPVRPFNLLLKIRKKAMSKSKGLNPYTLLFIGLSLVLVLIGATAFALNSLMTRTNSDAAASILKETTKTQANSIDAQLSLILTSMQAIVRKFEIIDAVSSATEDNTTLNMLSEQIKEDHTYALQAYLIPHGKAESYPLSFAELDQVKRTEKGEVAQPEAIMADNEWHFIVSTPIWNTKRDAIVGTLFISYSIDRLKPTIQAFDHTYGSSSLVQMFDGTAPRIVFTIGDVKPALEKQSFVQVGKTPWYILFTPVADFYQKQGMSPSFLIGVLAALGVTLSLVIIFLVRVVKSSGIAAELIHANPIQVSSAKTISKGGKADAALVSNLATQASRKTDDDFHEISDPLFQHNNMMDVAVEEDTDAEYAAAVAQQAAAASPQTRTAVTETSPRDINSVIFRDYDIRGDANLYLSNEAVFAIGQAIGSEAQSRGQTRIAVAADGRTSSPRVKEALINGMTDSGASVIDIGNVPSPVLYFVTETTDINSGVMVTASHNPASDNGFKIILKGKTLSDDGIQSLQNRIITGNFLKGNGRKSQASYTSSYIEKITADIALSNQMKVVVDCGNGIAGELAPSLLSDLGCEVIPLFCNVDGNFPNHDPDPSVDSNLNSLINKVLSEKADLGIALDGDGDRLVAISSSGKIVTPDRLLMLFAKDIVSRNPGTDVIFDVKSTRRLNSLISGYGGRPLMWKSGHAHIKAKMQETGALLGGEFSGHIFFKERWYGFDDGIYAAARLLEILTSRDQSLDAALSTLPVSAITPEIRIRVDEDKKFELVERLLAKGDFSGGKITTLDGLRVDFSKGWGLVRASNTSSYLTLRFEADNDDMLDKIRDMFRQQMKAIIPEVTINF